MQQSAEPLAQLRDIHTPAIIEVWPPALGWWMIATFCFLLIAAALILLIRVWRANRYRREALSELNKFLVIWNKNNDDYAYLRSLQSLLKRTALTTFPRKDVAGLTGEAWVHFLDQATNRNDFSIGEGEALIDGVYRADFSVDVNSLNVVAKMWIRKHSPKHLKSRKNRFRLRAERLEQST